MIPAPKHRVLPRGEHTVSDEFDQGPGRLVQRVNREQQRGLRSHGPMLLTVFLAMLSISGCASQHPGPRQGPGPWADAANTWPAVAQDHHGSARAGCDLPQGEILPRGNLTIALTDSVTAKHAPVPRNQSERLVFAQLYETLVRVDCAGNLLPGLASSWTCTADSSTWVFTLRENAYFWDGTLVTAADVLFAWNQAQDQSDHSDPWSWLDTHAGTINVLSGRRLSISLPEPQADFPLLLAHPATAVAAARQGWLWPVGSGPARLTAGTPEPLPDLACIPNQHHPRAPRWQTLTFHCRPLSDPRDLINQSWDLLPVSTLQSTAFFRAFPAYQIIPLPLNQTYLLLCPPGQGPQALKNWWPNPLPGNLSQALTTVAWKDWDRLVIPGPATSFCPQLLGPLAAPEAALLAWNLADKNLNQHTLVYLAGDPGARQLAEFLAARLPAKVRLVPLASAPLKFVLQWQMVGAGIMAIPQEYPTGCLQLASLLGSIGWLQAYLPGHKQARRESLAQAQEELDSGTTDPVAALVGSGTVHPLGATHQWLIMRQGLVGLQLGYDGVPWLENCGWDQNSATTAHEQP